MERKVVKLRVDMYSDTKFKIIDTMEDRNLIHYIWTRLLTLAGKVNLEGELYLSKSIPYSIETLALEFNRSANKVTLALKVFMDLEMIELTKNNVYRVRNFAKHQNIKPKKKVDNTENLETVDHKGDNTDVNGTIINKEEKNSTFNFEKEKQNKLKSNDEDKDNNDIKVIEFNSDKKTDADVVAINVGDNSETLSKDISDKSTLNKNLLKNDVSKKDKVDLDKKFVFNKAENKKKRNKPNKPNKPKKKDEACDIISIWDDEDDDVEICGFSDKPPAGKLIRTFFTPGV